MRKPAHPESIRPGSIAPSRTDTENAPACFPNWCVSRLTLRLPPLTVHSSRPRDTRQSCSGFAQYSGPIHTRSVCVGKTL